MHARQSHFRKCKTKKSRDQDDSNTKIYNEGKLNDNNKTSKTEDDPSASDVHWVNSEDDYGRKS